MLDECLFPRDMMSGVQWCRPEIECQLTACMSLHGNLCYDGPLRRSVVPVKFLLVSFNLSHELETYNTLVVVWSGRRSTLRTAKHDT